MHAPEAAEDELESASRLKNLAEVRSRALADTTREDRKVHSARTRAYLAPASKNAPSGGRLGTPISLPAPAPLSGLKTQSLDTNLLEPPHTPRRGRRIRMAGGHMRRPREKKCTQRAGPDFWGRANRKSGPRTTADTFLGRPSNSSHLE